MVVCFALRQNIKVTHLILCQVNNSELFCSSNVIFVTKETFYASSVAKNDF